MSFVRTVNPNGGVAYRRVMEELLSNYITRLRPGNLDETPCADPHAGCCGARGWTKSAPRSWRRSRQEQVVERLSAYPSPSKDLIDSDWILFYGF